MAIDSINKNSIYSQIKAQQTNLLKEEKTQEKPIPAQNIPATQTSTRGPAPAKEFNLGRKFDNVINSFSTNVRNSADLNDTIEVPRTIFKGYFSFAIGTTLLTLGSLASHKFVKKPLMVLGSLTGLFGTYNFVKPYLLRQEPKVKEAEQTDLKA